ncbi:ATP-grasp domain-containing protein [Paraburkholderia sp. D15]|uniref:ATP-grasp domain-containing protein n=1 Tax=Paraburkholderia sp. D15 TaxID=2880218 RepID=UPI002478D3A3|nr:ATP-grasp domain-containing protein [Paraburkholderia sp. D15]WGS51296.1 ATP-grasp domain-containing protein [Paraburkholderia sp. D15]
MRQVHWIIQENRGVVSNVADMAAALKELGHVPHLVQLQRGAGVPELTDVPPDVPVVCHGPGFVTRAVGHPRLGSGIYYDAAVFRWSKFHENWNAAMLAEDGHLTSLGDAASLLATGTRFFVRPDADSKDFDGNVYDAEGLAAATIRKPLPPDLPVIIASPLVIDAEWRFFVVQREVVACSAYRRGGQPAIDDHVPYAAIEMAISLAEQWSPADVFCLDLGACEGRFGVIEANCFNASRFYAANGVRILQAVSDYAARQFSSAVHPGL